MDYHEVGAVLAVLFVWKFDIFDRCLVIVSVYVYSFFYLVGVNTEVVNRFALT